MSAHIVSTTGQIAKECTLTRDGTGTNPGILTRGGGGGIFSSIFDVKHDKRRPKHKSSISDSCCLIQRLGGLLRPEVLIQYS